MDPLLLNAAKNRRTGFLTGLRRRVVNVKTICNNPEALELDKLSTASDRLEEAWRKYENSQQEVLSLVLEDEVEEEQDNFTEMDKSYKDAINKAKTIIKGKSEAEDEWNSQPA